MGFEVGEPCFLGNLSPESIKKKPGRGIGGGTVSWHFCFVVNLKSDEDRYPGRQ